VGKEKYMFFDYKREKRKYMYSILSVSHSKSRPSLAYRSVKGSLARQVRPMYTVQISRSMMGLRSRVLRIERKKRTRKIKELKR
jgi:hypothetical protein